ncbi:MAG: hypothetical protein WBG92_23795 [Thiohalocapsa sp.]
MIVDEQLTNGVGEQCNDDLRPNETLDAYLTRIIAADNDVTQDEVTSEWISEQREKTIYPSARFRKTSVVGGKLTNGLRSLSRRDFDFVIRRGELSLWHRFADKDAE